MEDEMYFNQPQQRKAEFINPPNILKSKVGSGGLSDEIIKRAQILLEENTTDFKPLAAMYLTSMQNGIEAAKGETVDHNDHEIVEEAIAGILYPAMQLKANGAMFQYHLVSDIAEKLVYFLEVISEIDIEALEIILAFHTTLKAVINGEIKGSGGEHGDDLLVALNNACLRYFDKNL